MAFKICLVGCGNHSALVHGPSLQKYAQTSPDTVLAACCDLMEEKAKSYQEKFGFERYYTDMSQMLDEEKPDAVCVIVPEPFVRDTAIAVMEKGYHVEMEKPPGLCKEDTLQMIAVARKAGVINQVAFNRRHMPLVKALKKELATLEEGTLQNISYEFYRYERREPSFETTAIHGIDVVKSIVGSDYLSVQFSYQEMPALGEKVCNIFMDCVFENGVRAQLRFCPCSGVVIDRACVNATGHTFFLETPIWNGFDTPGRLVHVEAGNLKSEISGDDVCTTSEMFETNGFYDENVTFFNQVRRGQMCEDDILSCLQSVELAECIKNRVLSYHK